MNQHPASNRPDANLHLKDGDGEDEQMDRLLQAHLASPVEHLTPSSGFALSVMEAIHQQATEPPPIAFPWRRVMPGAIAILCALAAFGLYIATGTSAQASHATTQLLAAPSHLAIVLCSVLLGTCIAAVGAAASFRLAGRS